MNSISSIAQSGMSAAMVRMDVAANNIANLQTAGYRRQTVLQQEQAQGGVDATVGRAALPGENLAEDIVQQLAASYAFKANLRTIQTHDVMMGALLDLRA
ncbi:flagellar basal body rod protein FlgC [Piscinibacter sp.]|uniref:flagellar basal body rod protein FlgC n=1 Tax=Piscinibacter sp. TaxID=1903157 RepID=UPI003559A532